MRHGKKRSWGLGGGGAVNGQGQGAEAEHSGFAGREDGQGGGLGLGSGFPHEQKWCQRFRAWEEEPGWGEKTHSSARTP